MTSAAIRVTHLRKAYPGKVAVQDVSFEVRPGEIFGVLGPNGAGKTTTVECVAGLRQADGGQITVLGVDPQAHPEAVREHIGVQFQETHLHDKITVREALGMFAAFHANPADVDNLIGMLGLTEKADARFKTLSGGQKQRVSIALALIGKPAVAILDEMTTGLDPQARRDVWDAIRAVREAGTTVLLVTHFMEEAERLCDRLVLIDSGRVVAEGTPADLIAATPDAASLEDVFVARTAASSPRHVFA
ncbi:ABC transporter ATP-binding protein [Xylanimonas ulmi]|uniref:ABC-2 type transport system ATP-binding protein n=1 Tax=Xylanimonas ulmi TaxID=228973 RepID=A0A4Q7M812_9MICO|nr:ABC transporter ATP-binding protein [Xylanibacterium ulmi]RZS62828.1 ABC-2 type transport system ATP-binding protein [Xylanibacterium ulmi]